MLDTERRVTTPLPAVVSLTPDEVAVIEAIRRIRQQTDCTRLLVVRIEHDRLGVMPCDGVRWHNRNR